jgi:putative ABC transport system substrate-binding protein
VRWADGFSPALPQLAATLVKEKPDAIVTTCIPSTRAAKEATGTLPVVMSVDGDPVAAGLVASLARPGANVTGTSTLFEELIPKWLELISAAVPKIRDVAILRNPDNVVDPYFWGRFEDAAKAKGVKVLPFEARAASDLDRAFTDMSRQRAGALIVMTEGFLASQAQRVVPLAARYKLPAIYGFREFAEIGGLMSYGLSYHDYYKGVARYLDAVLKGAKPANLPVEQPTKIELVINLETARSLGLVIPPQLLARADRVIA